MREVREVREMSEVREVREVYLTVLRQIGKTELKGIDELFLSNEF